MGYKAWRTPHDEESVYGKLNDEFGFTIDVAASHANALVDRYCTELGTFQRNKPAEPTKLSNNDGLMVESWVNERVWCNPPYDDILPWVECANARVALVSVMLLPPSIDTAWFRAVWVPASDYCVVTTRETDWYRAVVWNDGGRYGTYCRRELRFLDGRIRFWRPASNLDDGTPNEDDEDSVPGDQPRAGNIVVVTHALKRGQ